MNVEREQAVLRHLYRCLPSVDLPCFTTSILQHAGHLTGSSTMISGRGENLILAFPPSTGLEHYQEMVVY